MPGFAINNTDSFNSIDHKAEFHRSHRWRIEDLGAPLSFNIRAGLYAKTLELPSLSFEEEKVDGASIKYKFPKRAIWENITVSLYDVYGLYDVLRAWQNDIWTPEGGLRVANFFKGDAKFVLTNGKGAPTQLYTLVGCYPTKISHGELSAASSDIKLLYITYAYDYATIKLLDKTQRPTGDEDDRYSLLTGRFG